MELQLHLASLRYIFILGLIGGAPNCESRSSAFQREKYSVGLCLGLLRRVGSDVVFHNPAGRLSTCIVLTNLFRYKIKHGLEVSWKHKW